MEPERENIGQAIGDFRQAAQNATEAAIKMNNIADLIVGTINQVIAGKLSVVMKHDFAFNLVAMQLSVKSSFSLEKKI